MINDEDDDYDISNNVNYVLYSVPIFGNMGSHLWFIILQNPTLSYGRMQTCIIISNSVHGERKNNLFSRKVLVTDINEYAKNTEIY